MSDPGMNRRSIFRLFASMLPAFAIGKLTTPVKAASIMNMSYNDELLDGRLPTSIWLLPIPKNERYSDLPNQHRLGGPWYHGTARDPAPAGAEQYLEITRPATIFTTVGKSGRVYKQSFLPMLDAIKQSLTKEQVEICRAFIPSLLAANVPQHKWPLCYQATYQLSEDELEGWPGYCNNGRI